ncbi:MAG: acyl-CoA thioesterase [Verrucomicrobiales bacterium]|nr:acyl-CoA thioesterase [Verrucomicrobiales bacterium]
MNSTKSLPLSRIAWGSTIGLSWMWGLGLFFSVQFTIQFGILGLLCFAIPNAIGLFLFGLITDKVANLSDDRESLAKFYDAWSKPFKLPLFLYQIAALSLTIFAIIRYLWQPLGLTPGFIYLPLGVLIVLAAAFLFGEEFNIKRIKWSHTAMLLIALVAILVLAITNQPALFTSARPFAGDAPLDKGYFLGYLVPICVGFLVGPWMDLQQWQRAIQIRREGKSITKAYALGSGLFFLLLLFHGGLANWAMTQGAGQYMRTGLLDFTYGHQVLTQFFHAQIEANPVVFGAYATFVCVCILTTLDSGYIAMRWFFTSYVSQSNNIIFQLMPIRLMTSPIPAFLLATIIAAVGLLVGLELEYFMIFYATFFVAYSALGMLRTLRAKTNLPLPQVKMFCVGALSVVIFSFGYLREIPFFLVCGSLIPVGYILWLWIKSQTAADSQEVLVEKVTAPVASKPVVKAESSPVLPAGAELAFTSGNPELMHDSSGHFEGKTFVHSFLSTYGDTNSVGNIYFGMYAMWVGKTRELFLRKVMPDFDVDTSDFFILTRSFEHKFVREAKEFENIRIELSLGEHNRKFVELNHKVLNGANKVLGKGKQSLMFVASEDYSLLDIPAKVHTAFVPYATTLERTLR